MLSGTENSTFAEGVASGVVSEIGSLLPGYADVALHESQRHVQAICSLKAAEETIIFDNCVFGRAWYAIATVDMKPAEKREFLGRMVRA